MPNYDFLNLSPIEFEDISRDLLQKELKITLESFTAGKDGGIDLRYSPSSESNLIVQCKRYGDFKTLFSTLKKETEKVKKLSPKRYILTTSVGLTPIQKNQIATLFKPFIKSEGDVYGKDDLNNLLGKFPEIEKLHFKLWLSSTTVLERIFRAKIYNQTNFEEENIKETLKVYVENKSFHKALEILKKNRFVILSGVPGIGKTTLGRILVCHALGNEFDEFIFLSNSIDEGYEVYAETKKQVFL